MKKRKLKKPVKYTLVFILILIGFLLIYKAETGPVNKSDEIITFEVEKGSTYNSIAHSLKEKNLIKSELFYKIYIKLHKPNNLQVGSYPLSSNMNLKKLVNTLNGNAKSNMVKITFNEGVTFTDVVNALHEKLGIPTEDIYDKVKDTNYIDSLIEKYWFLTDDIKDKDIYYALEGYLFPDTYLFNKGSSVEDVLEFMLNNTELKLNDYKSEIEKSDYTIHEMMTMASIVEKEASNSDDRQGVAGVFYNRLESGMSLGSDVTTYYGIQVKLTDRDLTDADLKTSNGYNTRNSNMAGKLPVGPICMPGIESVKAAIEPTKHNYLFFVADKNGKTYFTKTNAEHNKMVSKLKSEGLWFNY